MSGACLTEQAPEKQLDIGRDRLIMRAMHRNSENLVQEPMMDDYADKGAGSQEGI